MSSVGVAASRELLLTLGEAGLGGASDSALRGKERVRVSLGHHPEDSWNPGEIPSQQAEFGSSQELFSTTLWLGLGSDKMLLAWARVCIH